MDVKDQHLNLKQWYDVIETALHDPTAEPILNLSQDGTGVYDAIFVGGGAGGKGDLASAGGRDPSRLAEALAPERPSLLAVSPWLRCVETAAPLAAALGVDLRLDDRLGYDQADMEGWIREAGALPGAAVVGVGHGDLIPMYLLRARLLERPPTFRTGSLFRVRLEDGRPVEVAYVDRDELPDLAG
jgi:broad specificity phosphatase PhoE